MQSNINIWQLTTYKTNAIASNFLDIKTYNEIEKLSNINNNFIIMGWGSNLLMKEDKYENITFIKYSIQQDWKQVWEDDEYIYFQVFTWENLAQTILKAQEYTNQMNPLFWLPGTLWGAIIWNAGSFGKEIGNFIKNIDIYNIKTNEITTMTQREINFSYRNTNLKNKELLVISAILQIPKKSNKNVLTHIEYSKNRIKHQPKGKGCGSWFQNYKIQDNDKLDKLFSNIKINSENDKSLLEKIDKWLMSQIPAGWLIDQAWLKWFEKDWVIISEKHANFILNIGTNKWQNIYNMGDLAKNKVADKLGVILEEEVKIIYNWESKKW